jgi:small subunit ribosomal protein S29
MLRRCIRNLCSELTTPKTSEKVRVISFDLPVSIDSTRLSERERHRKNVLEGVSKEGSKSDSAVGRFDEFFPTSLLSPQPEDLPPVDPVRLPLLWMRPDEIPTIADVGRFLRFSREELLNLLPEGLAGELPRDIFLMPSRTRDIGIMYRKTTNEIITQLRLMEGLKSIPKSGWLLEGKRGTGKSSILNTVVAWARKQGNWIVLFEPLGSRFGKEIATITKSSCGVYIQNELAKQFLERFMAFNRGLLEELPVNQDFYGRVGIDSSQIETIERVYLPLIEQAVNQKTGISLDERIREISRLRKSLVLPSVKSQLKEPQSVAELCEFGINNTTYATQVVAEIINQLKAQDKFPVLVAVDEFNELFVVSEYVSTRYENTIFNGYIPSYHLSLPRMLCRWDGHEFKRGLKLYATSWAKRNRRQFDPTILGIKPEEIKQVRNFTKLEFAHYLAYQQITGTSHRFPKSKLSYFYMLTQGNGFQARRVLATLH